MSLAATTTAAAAGSPPLVGAAPQWATLVKRSLSPRLVRLPILSLVFLHLALAIVHMPTSLHSTMDLILLPLRPTLFLCSLLAFIVGILPTLVLRRRILARSTWQAALCGPAASPSATSPLLTLPLGIKISTDTTSGQALYRLSLSSTWLSAVLDGLASFLSNAFLVASFAAYSAEPTWWLPYQRVPSTRKSTGSFGRTVTTTTHHWRPNEAVWLLFLQPFVLGVASSLLASALPQGIWSIPPLRVPQFPTSLINCLPASIGGATSTSSTLSKRISSTISPLVVTAALQYFVLSTALLLIYLPLRLPFFRLLLILLPPYSALRRMVIPSLRSGFSLTTPSHLTTLFLTSGACALVQGATRALAANLWEVYATHPLAITAAQVVSPMAQGANGKSLEVMIGALEKHAPRSTSAATATANSAAESEAERAFLFTHALFDFTALCTDTTTQGAQVRRAFFKHFAVPSAANASASASTSASASASAGGGGGGATVSAWERVSEVLLGVVEGAVDAWDEGAKAGAGSIGSAQKAGDLKKGPGSSVAIAARSKGKELEVVKGGMIGSAPPPSATTAGTSTARPTAAQGQIQGQSSAVESTGLGQTTVWQRLVAPPAPSTGGGSSASSSTSQVAKAPAPAPAPASSTGSAPTSSSSRGALAPLAGTLQALSTRAISLLPAQISSHLPSTFGQGTSAALAGRSPSSSPSAIVSGPVLLHLLLITHAIYTLLLFSLQEDEWGSVTLSERRAMGVEKWVALGGKVERSVKRRVPVPDGEEEKEEEKEKAEAGGVGVGQGARADAHWDWRLLLQEVQRGREGVAREFGMVS